MTLTGLTSSLLASTLAGIGGTGLGAIIAIIAANFMRNNRQFSDFDDFIKLFMGFSGGIMTAVVCFDLLPDSYTYAGVYMGTVATLAGCIFIPIIEIVSTNIRKALRVLEYSSKYISKNSIIKKPRMSARNRYLKLGIIVFVGIALHNLPEGLAMGSSFCVTTSYGITLTFVICLHNVPEGIAMAVPLIAAGKKSLETFWTSLLAGSTTVIGAILGWYIAGISSNFIGMCFGFAGGAMMYVVIGQLFPMCFETKESKNGVMIFILIGILLGFLAIKLV